MNDIQLYSTLSLSIYVYISIILAIPEMPKRTGTDWLISKLLCILSQHVSVESSSLLHHSIYL